MAELQAHMKSHAIILAMFNSELTIIKAMKYFKEKKSSRSITILILQ